MIEEMRTAFKKQFPAELVDSFIESYVEVKDKFRQEKWEDVLYKSGRFSEQTFRLLHYLRTKQIIHEVPDQAEAAKQRRVDVSLPEALRLLTPQVLRAIIYSIRSKKDAVHVKQSIATFMDANLNMMAINWVISEFLRELCDIQDGRVQIIIENLMKRNYPLVQEIEDQLLVNRKLGAEAELLMLLAHKQPNGMNRREIGISLGIYAAPTVSNVLRKMQNEKLIHQGKSEQYYITDSGLVQVDDISLSQ